MADTYIAVDGDNKSEAVSTELHSRQVWKSLDGRDGWLIEAGETSDKGITLQSDIPDSSAYNALAELPTDPDTLLQRIYRASTPSGTPQSPATRRPSSRSAICCSRATRPPRSAPPSTRPRPRSPASSR